MTGFAILLRKELHQQWATRTLPVVAITFGAIGLASPLLARYLPELITSLLPQGEIVIEVPPPVLADAIDQILRNLGQAGVLVAILLAMGSMAAEKERGTAALVLTKPASRDAFVLAKALGLLVTLGVVVTLGGAAGYLYTALLFEAPDPAGYAGMAALLLLQLAAYAAVAFLGSTLTRSAAAAAGLGVGALVVIAIIAALPTIGDFSPGTLVGPATAWALGRPAPDWWQPVVGTLGLIGLVLTGALVSFRHQEL